MRQRLTQHPGNLTHDSLRALAYGIFSKDHKLPELRQKATLIYGASLQKMASSLATSSKSEVAELIKPVAIMGSYSVSWPLSCISNSTMPILGRTVRT